MNRFESRTKTVIILIISVIIMLGIHFFSLYNSRTDLIENTKVLNQLRLIQANTQRLTKNELLSNSSEVFSDYLTVEIESIVYSLDSNSDSFQYRVKTFENKWNNFVQLLNEYRKELSLETRNEILYESDILWNLNEVLIVEVENKMSTDLQWYWFMLFLLVLSISLILFTLIFIWKTVKGSMMGMALRDPLTGCFNRNYFSEFYEEQMKLYTRYNHNFTIALIDIDHFKKVNDTFGHDVGDEVLKQLVGIIRSRIRSSDVLVRYGGEEFIILFPNTDLKTTKTVCEKLRETVETSKAFACGEITISIGISGTHIISSETQNMVKDADIALYQAKNNGRNQIKVYEGS